MSGRTLLSRPRTRVYDANYSIGESYYKSALDRIDRKYSGRPLSPPKESILQSVAARHAQAFEDEDLLTSRRRAEKHITEDNLFDSRGARINGRALGSFEDELTNESSATLKKIRANKKVSIIDDVDLESTTNSLRTQRMLDRSEKILGSVGITESSRKALDEEVSYKRRSRLADENEPSGLTKWTLVNDEAETAAAQRARQSKARIDDLDEEMALLAEKQAARERRVARLKALVAETEAETVDDVEFSSRKEKKSVRF